MTAVLSSSVIGLVSETLAAAVPDRRILDGSSASADMRVAEDEFRWVSIGDPWDDDEEPVTVDRSESGAVGRRREDYTIACGAYAASGDDDFTVLRGLAAEDIAAIDTALQADRTLGGAVARARLGDVDRIAEGSNAQGIAVRVGFTIQVTVLP